MNLHLKISENTAVGRLLLAKREVRVDIRSRDNDKLTALEIAASSAVCLQGYCFEHFYLVPGYPNVYP